MMVELTAEQKAQCEHDCEAAKQVALRAENDACQLIAKIIADECENNNQRTMASAILTAAMIVKFSEVKLAVPDEAFGLAVDQMVEELRPMMKEAALDVRFGQRP